MANDPRAPLIHQWFRLHEVFDAVVADQLAELDDKDPLRRALREPSDYLIDKIAATLHDQTHGSGGLFACDCLRKTRVVLAALAEAVTPQPTGDPREPIRHEDNVEPHGVTPPPWRIPSDSGIFDHGNLSAPRETRVCIRCQAPIAAGFLCDPCFFKAASGAVTP